MNVNTIENLSIPSEKRRKGQQNQQADVVDQDRTDGGSSISELSHGSDTSSSMKGTTRYTITSRQGLQTKMPSIEDSLRSPIQIPPPAVVTQTPGSHTATADLSSHAGQTGKIHLPQIGDDVTSRLEGLKLYRNWNKRIREEAQNHNRGTPYVVAQSSQVPESVATGFTIKTISSSVPSTIHPAYQRGLPIRQRSGSIDTRVDAAPTPFSNPTVVPVANTTSTAIPVPTLRSPLVHTAALPGLTFPETVMPPRVPEPRRKRSTVINSMPTGELLERSRSRSSSRSSVPTALKPHTRDHRYPPVSFPKSFNEYEQQSGSDLLTSTRRRPTPSISPMTRPKSEKDMIEQPQLLATPHDKRRRPMFYSTIHYYTECPHASPPATRPLDPDFQPRIDPDFHRTNPAISRSVIPGSCFNCDTMQRRAHENVILDDFTNAIIEFKDKLTLRLDQLDQLDQVDDESSDAEFEAYGKDMERLQASCTFPEDAHDLRHQLSSSSLPPLHDQPDAISQCRHMTPDEKSFQARLIKEIRQMQVAIDTLRAEQDSKVKAVWAGYTRRWGPATLGVQRGNWASDLERYETKDDHDAMLEYTRRSIEKRLAMPDEIDHLDLEHGGLTQPQELQIVGIDGNQEEEGVSARRSTSHQGMTGGSRMRRTERSISRSSSQRSYSSSSRDNPAGLNPGEGKMQISWHR